MTELDRLRGRLEMAMGVGASLLFHIKQKHPECCLRDPKLVAAGTKFIDVLEAADELVQAMCDDEEVYNGVPLPVRSKLEKLAGALTLLEAPNG